MLRELLKDETAGDPISGVKWTRKTIRQLTKVVRGKGYRVGRETVRLLMIKLGYRLRSNRKRLNRRQNAHRDEQMRYIKQVRKSFERAGNPVISVDSKKRELVGNIKNAGRTWRRAPLDVLENDYPNDAVGVAIPYGIYDVLNNRGFVVVGCSHQRRTA